MSTLDTPHPPSRGNFYIKNLLQQLRFRGIVLLAAGGWLKAYPAGEINKYPGLHQLVRLNVRKIAAELDGLVE
jgi:hypothetical protein